MKEGDTLSLHHSSYSNPGLVLSNGGFPTSSPQVPFKTPPIPSNRDHKALHGGTLKGIRKKLRSRHHS